MSLTILDQNDKKELEKNIENTDKKIVSPDWNAKEGESGHILNRTHYEDIQSGTIISDVELTINADFGAFLLTDDVSNIVAGGTYTVTYNGTTYECVGVELDGMSGLGNIGAMTGGTDTGEPFIIGVFPEPEDGLTGMVMTLDGLETITLSISGVWPIVTQLDEKYIPKIWVTNICNGKADGSLRSTTSTKEDEEYSLGYGAVALGYETKASGYTSYAEGSVTIASGEYSHAEGANTTASGVNSHAEGGGTIASGVNSHAEGLGTTASDITSHAEGSNTKASGSYSHSEGLGTTASGISSHAEGEGTTASGRHSHSEGYNTIAAGNYSHAEGGETEIIEAAGYAHAEGKGTRVTNSYAHAEGQNSWASGLASHVEGNNTDASGIASHAEGDNAKARVDYSHAEGWGTNTGDLQDNKGCHVQGRFNTIPTDTDNFAHVVGNGTDDTNRSNAHTLDWDGNAWYAGSVEGTALILKSSTEGSTKRFKITVDDSGILTATDTTS